MDMRRNGTALLAAALLAAAVAGCSGGKSDGESKSSAAPSGSAAPSAAGSATPAKEKVTIKMGIMKAADHGDFKTMKVVTDYEQKSNIHIDWVEVPQQNFTEKWNLMLTSGDYPEAFYGRGMENSGLDEMYGRSGVFLPLNDLIDKYAPNIKKMFDTVPGARARSMVDGKIYSIPNPASAYHIQTEHKFYINKVWLDKLGLKVPTTTDELYEVLKAFKANDLNGNGKADEIPFTTWVAGGYDGLDTLFGSWGVPDNARDHTMLNNGKVVFVPAQEGYRKGLEFLNKLYKEGLIDQEVFTQTDQQLTAKGSGKDVVVGSFIRHIGDYVVGTDRFKDYVAVPVLKGPDGLQLATKIDFPRLMLNTFVITNKNKHPEDTIRWLDYMFTEQGALEFNFGPENVAWKWNGDGTWEVLPPPAGVNSNTFRNGNSPGGYGLTWMSEALNQKGKVSSPIEQAYIDHTKMYEPYFPKEVYPTLRFSQKQSEALSTVKGSLFNYVQEMEGKFITGQTPLSKWDDYLKELDKIGLKTYLQVYQEAYDSYKAIK
ncbi:extracellular solute-binding protein [Paenibacillus cymbidii]|uniref:extracellular solute-binding protein n=1 Tax=Paenibacillus cymbidii TaxID=1639034 RepID=UPI001436891E|nr:extracellular solute-binding protein [Paenibacillus cymbidii]